MIQRVAMIVALVASAAVAGQVRADDKEKFQGTWKAEKAVRGGMEAPADELAKMQIEFKGNKAIPKREDGQEREDEFTLDEKKKPKTIDVKTSNGRTLQGIYEVEGDTLKLCLSVEGDRPAKFESAEGSKTMLLVLKRAKK